MRHRATIFALFAATLSVVPVPPAAGANAPPKPGASKPPVARPKIPLLLPDIAMSIATDGSVSIQNVGDANVPKPFLVQLDCKVVTATQRRQTCGNPFDANGRWLVTVTLPAGHKEAPLKESPGQVTFIRYGPGWAMLYPAVPSWPNGVYNLAGCANPDPADPAKRIREKTKNNNCAFKDVAKH
jgi:hypothetical protein